MVKVFQLCRRMANSAPWIDTEVLKAVRKKERLGKKAKKSSSVYHWGTFRRCRVELKSLIKWKRKQYFKGLSSTLTENPKRFWAYYQSKYKNKRLPSSVRYDGVNVSDAQGKTELFNNYFNSVFKSDPSIVFNHFFVTRLKNWNQISHLPHFSGKTTTAELFVEQGAKRR